MTTKEFPGNLPLHTCKSHLLIGRIHSKTKETSVIFPKSPSERPWTQWNSFSFVQREYPRTAAENDTLKLALGLTNLFDGL